MTEAEARHLLLVRAVEKEDTAFTIFTTEDREQATAAGLQNPAELGRRSDEDGDAEFLIRRSEFAFTRIVTRVPALAQADRQVRWPPWIDWALPALALGLGVATNEIDAAHRLNIIAFPLLTMLVWNIAAYIVLAAMQLRLLGRGKQGSVEHGPLARVMNGILGWGRLATSHGTVSGRAIGQFVRDWLSVASKLNQARIRRALHLSAAALAAGVLLGMYARALGVEYRAGWESTFINAETLHRFVQVVLGPASGLTGVTLPDIDRLQAIRWGQDQNGENAGPWIHLFATTVALFIIGPRLLLAGWETSRTWWLARRIPVPGHEDFYTRRLLRDARDIGALVRVVPYSFRLPAPTEQRLSDLLKAVLGDRAEVTIDTPVAFGGEDVWLDALSIDPETDQLVVLFNLSATPEAETHGAFIEQIKGRLERDRGGPALSIIIDESAYARRLADQAGSAQRLQERRSAWKSVIGRVGVTELAVDLIGDDESVLVAKLESVILQEPGLTARVRAQ